MIISAIIYYRRSNSVYIHTIERERYIINILVKLQSYSRARGHARPMCVHICTVARGVICRLIGIHFDARATHSIVYYIWDFLGESYMYLSIYAIYSFQVL